MKGTLEVLSRMIDIRDPYTAGHQRRVALIARAIAEAMGLPARQVELLEMAGMVHDIGKISVPVEILTKPIHLSDVEFEIVKGHAQAGYDIIEGVPLPAVIADAIWQHHERLDGSGYPRGLMSDQIIMEARILAVADVLESMASHRPYRPALGVDVALQELQEHSGTLYDSKVVDTITRLLEDKRLNLDEL